MSARALVLQRHTGGTVSLAVPIPDRAVITLRAMLAATVREWVIVRGEGSSIEIAGHRFVPTGWDGSTEPPGVIIEHRCSCTLLDAALAGLDDD